MSTTPQPSKNTAEEKEATSSTEEASLPSTKKSPVKSLSEPTPKKSESSNDLVESNKMVAPTTSSVSINHPRVAQLYRKKPGFYISGGNGTHLVEDYLLKRGYERIYDRLREDYKLRWCEIKNNNNYVLFREGEQMLYQIPNSKLLTTKIGLLSSLREYDRVMNKVQNGSRSRIMNYRDFFPESYRLDVRTDREEFFQVYKRGEIWISKPTSMNQGKGIYLIRSEGDVEKIQERFKEPADDDGSNSRKQQSGFRAPMARLVQRYVRNPLLLEGKKFDVRNYMIIACTNPLVLFYRDGYCRLTCTDYDVDSMDLTGHLTNQFMQKKSPIYEEVKEETVWSMDRFNEYINENHCKNGANIPLNWVNTVLRRKCQQIMLHCFHAVRHRLECRLGYFDLYGCDFLIHDDFSVSILEINNNPALHTNCEALREITPNVVNDTLGLSIECFEKSNKGERLQPFKTQHKSVLLYNADHYEELERRERLRHVYELQRKNRNNWRKKNFNASQYIYRRNQKPEDDIPDNDHDIDNAQDPDECNNHANDDDDYTDEQDFNRVHLVTSPSQETKTPLKPFYAGCKTSDKPTISSTSTMTSSSVAKSTQITNRYKHVQPRVVTRNSQQQKAADEATTSNNNNATDENKENKENNAAKEKQEARSNQVEDDNISEISSDEEDLSDEMLLNRSMSLPTTANSKSRLNRHHQYIYDKIYSSSDYYLRNPRARQKNVKSLTIKGISSGSQTNLNKMIMPHRSSLAGKSPYKLDENEYNKMQPHQPRKPRNPSDPNLQFVMTSQERTSATVTSGGMTSSSKSGSGGGGNRKSTGNNKLLGWFFDDKNQQNPQPQQSSQQSRKKTKSKQQS